MSIKAFFEIIRPLNCLLAGVGALAGYAIATKSLFFSLQALAGFGVAFLVCAAGQAINDYFDAEIDKKLHPKKPVPSGRIAKKHALYFSLSLFALGILASFSLPFLSTAIAVAFSLLLAAYSALMKKAKFLGNFVVAAGTGFTIIFGSSIAGSIFPAFLLAASAFFANTAREIIKDLEDMPKEKEHKRTLPMLLPQKIVSIIILVFYALSIIFSLYAFFSGFFGNNYFVFLVGLSSILFFWSFLLVQKKKYSIAQKASKTGMFIALLAFFAGAAF